jgi:anti-sigma regulatory factor (Ser/Thr protein kinase)
MTQEHVAASAERTGSSERVLTQLRIAPRAEEVGRARHWFHGCLRTWPDAAQAAAESVFGEITANAIRHGRGEVTLTVALSGRLVRCHVRDGSWRRPRCLGRPDAECEDGRGMVIVAALADDWGVRRHLRGKTIWFEVRAPA